MGGGALFMKRTCVFHERLIIIHSSTHSLYYSSVRSSFITGGGVVAYVLIDGVLCLSSL